MTAPYSLLVRNARIAHPDGAVTEGDLACRDGRIARIGGALDVRAAEALDANGLLLLPGVIDPHVHLREPGAEHKEDLASGSRACARGGVTSFLEMPNTDPATTDAARLAAKLARAARQCVVNYGFFMGATPHNLDELNRAQPTPGIKVFMGCSTGDLLLADDADLERVFAHGDRIIAVHAEDHERLTQRRAQFAGRTDPAVHSEIRDNETALIASARVLQLAKKYRRRLHILHMSTREEVELLRRDKPDWVKAEVSPNHLFLNIDDYAQLGCFAQMNPPLRTAADNAALWAGLRAGLIDFVGTDHAPHTLAEKQRPYGQAPSGMPGVETALPLMLTAMHAGRCTLAEILRWMCRGPAAAYGIANKGEIRTGFDADLTLVDMDAARPVRNEDIWSKCGWSPYAGRILRGWPAYTIVGGGVVFDRGRIRAGVRGRALTFAAPQENFFAPDATQLHTP